MELIKQLGEKGNIEDAYHLPLILSFTTAQKLKCNPILVAGVVAMMLHPTWIDMVAAAKATILCHEMCKDAKIGPAPNITAIYPETCKPLDAIVADNWVLDVS